MLELQINIIFLLISNLGCSLLQSLSDNEIISLRSSECDPSKGTGVCGPSFQGNLIPSGPPLQEECVDNLPTNSEFECSDYVRFNLCGQIDEQFCRVSCARCPQVCEDVLIPLTKDCSQIINGNNCNDPEIQGKYCQKSCGYCQVSQALSPPLAISTTVSIPAPTLPLTTLPTPPAALPFAQPIDDCGREERTECDVDALLSFKNNLLRGQSVLSSWEGQDACTDWDFITCDSINQRVIGLDLYFFLFDYNTLSGPIVPEFSKLRYIRSFEIFSQDVTGQFYKEFSVLDNLEKFLVAKTSISGTLPSTYSTWTNINHFAVSFNKVDGGIPKQWSTWNKLEVFHISNNGLDNLPKEFSAWTAIKDFDAAQNQIQGSLPVTLSAWTQCERFQSFENRMIGTLPAQYSSMNLMKDFAVYTNRFSGSLPVEYSRWEKLEILRVQENRLSGTLPTQYSQMVNIERFSARNNKDLSGSLPPEYSTFSAIQVFYAYDTSISPNIPQEWSTFSNSANIDVRGY